MVRGALARAQKRADEEGATIVWVDESGFYLLPLAVRTWAPRGATPILRVPLTRDHLSAISAITLEGRLFLQVRKDNYDGESGRRVPARVAAQDRGKLVVIWDGSPIHHGQAVKDFLARGQPNVYSWSSCRATPLISTRMRASGTTSSASSWAMSAAPIWLTCVTACAAPRCASATSPTSSAPALANADTCFSS